MRNRYFYLWLGYALLLLSCKSKVSSNSAFYYWKTTYQLNPSQRQLLSTIGDKNIYLRFFDITWDNDHNQAKPNAVLRIADTLKGLKVEPVIFITNQTFHHTQMAGIDSLAFKSAGLVSIMTSRSGISYQKIQIDCDWTDDTREKYFAYLKAFKKYNKHLLEATIRLHQVKYRERTGVPPVDRGVLMFYNMGQVKALGGSSSIYNEKDAAKYLGRLSSYPLKLDVALPLFSWAIHSRDGHILNIYTQIKPQDLQDQGNFKPAGNSFRAVKSFFLKGIYIKENDNFKLEETNLDLLNKAAGQLSEKLKPLPDRTIIFYELANINLPEFTLSALDKVIDHF
jgi:hypothetical protein